MVKQSECISVRQREMDDFVYFLFYFNENQLRFQPTFPQVFQLNLLGFLNACMIRMMFEVQNFCDGSYYTLVMHKKEIARLLVCAYVFLVGVKLYLLYYCNCKENECAKLVSYQRGENKIQSELLICWTVYLYSRIF